MTQIKVILILIFGLFIQVQGNYLISKDAGCVCKQWKLAFECGNDPDCEWNSNTKSCEQQLCKNIKSQSTCASDNDCQYVNGQCQDFTKCEDLQGKTINECRMMSGRCLETNGINCLPTAFNKLCSEFTTEGECRQGHDGFCAWDQNKCVLWNNCQQANQTRCSEGYLSCIWSYTQKECVQKKCSVLEQDSCEIVQEGPNSHLYQVCVWDEENKKCVETVPESLTFDICQEHTFGSYHWSESNPNDGYCEQCLSQYVQHPKPKHCSCVQLQSQLDCQQNQACKWKDNSCIQRECSEIDTVQSCLQYSKCAWYKNACVLFTQCDDYKAHSNLECSSINSVCIISQSLESCTSNYVKCSNHKTDDYCNASKSSSYQQCYWNEQTLSCQDWTECSQQRQATYCEYSGACFWDQGQCQQLKCEHFHEDKCSHYLISPKSSTWNYCMLFNKCQDLKPDLIGQDECYSDTYGSSSWRNNLCQQCKTEDSYQTIFKIAIYLIVIIII